MGNPLLDMSANTTQEQLDKYELKMGNAVLAEEKHLPLYAEVAAAEDILYVAGGATQNSVRVAQWMLQVPGATNYTGAIGNDAFGEQLSTCMADAGCGALYMKDEKLATGTCAVLIQDKERSLCANLAAANAFKQSHLDTEEVTAAYKAAQFYYIGGFFFTVCQGAIMQIARESHEAKKTLAINLSAPFIPQFFGAGIAEVMPFADIVFGNETEAAAYGGTQDGLGTDPQAVAEYIANLPKENAGKPRVCVITQGAEPTIIAVAGQPTITVPVPPVASEDIVDTNGAGDAYVGGFISQYVKGATLTKCSEAGNYSASKIIGVSGCVCPSSPPDFE